MNQIVESGSHLFLLLSCSTPLANTWQSSVKYGINCSRLSIKQASCISNTYKANYQLTNVSSNINNNNEDSGQREQNRNKTGTQQGFAEACVCYKTGTQQGFAEAVCVQ